VLHRKMDSAATAVTLPLGMAPDIRPATQGRRRTVSFHNFTRTRPHRAHSEAQASFLGGEIE